MSPENQGVFQPIKYHPIGTRSVIKLTERYVSTTALESPKATKILQHRRIAAISSLCCIKGSDLLK